MTPTEIRAIAAMLEHPGCPVDISRLAAEVLREYADKEERHGEA